MVGYYKRKRVLVTGADGFMGSHLCERLLEDGANVSVFVRGTSVVSTNKYKLRNIEHLRKGFDDVIAGNIASADSVDLVMENKPEIIFHLAADAYVPNSFDHPKEVMEANLVGTLNMLQAVKDGKGIRRIVCTSSSEIYGMTIGGSIDEEHPLYPSSPYAASKVAADRYAYAYWNTYHLPIAIIRPFNTYGPRHTYDVIPKFINHALKGQTITVHGTGRQTRDFTYVDDMIEAFLVMGRHQDAVGRAVNFGTGIDMSINYIARKVKELTGSDSKIVHIAERTAQVKRLCCDYSLARKLFKWKPRVFIDEGLKKNIEWARRYQSEDL